MQGRRDQGNESNNNSTEQEFSSANGAGQHSTMSGKTGRFRALLNETGRFRAVSDETGQQRAVSGETGRFRAISGETGYQRIAPGETARFRAMLSETGRMPALPARDGEYPPIPQRPPGMPRVEMPPEKTRVARPKSEPLTPRALRRRLLILACAIVVCAIIAFFATRVVINATNALSASSGAASTAVDFLNALDNQNYNQAYKDLGPAITLRLTPDLFKQQAQTYDHCFGPVQNYSEVANSATSGPDNSQSYTYMVTRSKSPKPFQLHLTLQQDENGKWGISDYGNSLGASQASCK
jgi:hypothetical protein